MPAQGLIPQRSGIVLGVAVGDAVAVAGATEYDTFVRLSAPACTAGTISVGGGAGNVVVAAVGIPGSWFDAPAVGLAVAGRAPVLVPAAG